MDADEREVVNYLQTWGATFVNAKEVARRASTKKRFGEEPDWARQVLIRLFEKGTVETDGNGRYRLTAEAEEAHGPASPETAQEDKAGTEETGPINIEDDI